MNTLWQDARYALRLLWQQPGFTLVAVLSLAIGIGANTTIFSVVNAVLLRPLPGIAQPARLVDVHATEANGSSYHAFSYPDYAHFREQNKTCAGLTAYSGIPLSMNAGAQPERLFGMIVSGNYFDVLGTKPLQGRFFLPEEDQTPGTHPVAVVSADLWRQRFGADPNLVGRTITLNGHAFTVVGVAPAGFRGTWVGLTPDVWVPLMMQAETRPGGQLLSRQARWLQVTGRLKDGVTTQQAQAELGTQAAQLAQAYPETNRGLGVDVRAASMLPGEVRGAVLGFMAILFVVVGLVLLIACANVAAMTLARASTRRKEMAIRRAMGASRRQLVSQLLLESVLLFLLGGTAGVLVAVWATDLLLAFKPPADMPISLEFGVDVRVLLFTLVISLVTGLLFGLAPALQASKPDVLSALKSDTPGGSLHRSRTRSVFVIAQIAISLVLLVTAGLFLRSLRNASSIDVGFVPDGVETLTLDLRTQGYDETKGREFYRQLTERVAALPGVRAASLARMVPLNGNNMMTGINISGHEPPPGQHALMVGLNIVDGRYFETVNMPLIGGRTFNETDRQGAPQAAIINETLARRYYTSANVAAAIGQSFSFGGDDDGQAERVVIVGIVKDAKYETLGEDARPYLYRPLQQSYSGEMTLHVRALPGEATRVLAAVRQEVGALDKDLPLLNVMPMTEQIGFSIMPLRLAATVVGTLGLLGLLLAAVGVFGVVNYSVAQRTRELGIRMALGAQPADVLRLVMRQGLRLALVGVGLGLAISFALTRALASLLYGVSATDPLIFIGMALLLVGVAFVASYIPARRATKVDPMVALRYE